MEKITKKQYIECLKYFSSHLTLLDSIIFYVENALDASIPVNTLPIVRLHTKICKSCFGENTECKNMELTIHEFNVLTNTVEAAFFLFEAANAGITDANKADIRNKLSQIRDYLGF